MPNYTEGSKRAQIIIIGGTFEWEEWSNKIPYSSYAGSELTKMLGEAGINKSDCFITNVVQEEKPYIPFFTKKVAKERGYPTIDNRCPHISVERGRSQIKELLEGLEPNLIITLGNIAFWAVTGISDNYTKWRGSVIDTQYGKVIPTHCPHDIAKNWSYRWVTVQDLKRAFREQFDPVIKKPDWEFLVRPTFDQAIAALESIRGKIVTCDIETRRGQISCVGFGISAKKAFCIPFMIASGDSSYWSEEEELQIILKLKDVSTAFETRCIFQNAGFDCQSFAKQWGYIPNFFADTMTMMHVCFPALLKALDFQASLFCEYYCYWKDNIKNWYNEEQYWMYNCEDCVRTYEIYETHLETIKVFGKEEQVKEQHALFWPTLKMMLKGFLIDQKRKRRLSGDLLVAATERNGWFENVLGHDLNVKSPKQMADLFYKDFGMRVIKDKKTKRPTCDDNALGLMKVRQPLLRPLIETIQEVRSIGVFKSTFADAWLDKDNRMRGSINLTGTETYRFSISKSVFGTGCNMQTLPKGSEE